MSDRYLNLDDSLYHYLVEHGVREHPAQAALRDATRSHPAAGMQIGPDQGALLALLVKLIGAKRTIEIGVFTGYSALAVALALPPDGRILACDISDEFTRVGRPYWERAGVAGRIELVLEPAVHTLDARLALGEAGRYDFAFIDADKANIPGYFEASLAMTRRGGLIVVDNVIREANILDPNHDDAVRGVRAFNDRVAREPRVTERNDPMPSRSRSLRSSTSTPSLWSRASLRAVSAR